MVLSEAWYRYWSLNVWLGRWGSCHVKYHSGRPFELGLPLGLTYLGLHLSGVPGDRHRLGETLPGLSANVPEGSHSYVAETKSVVVSTGFRPLAIYSIHHNLRLSRKSYKREKTMMTHTDSLHVGSFVFTPL